MAHTLATELIIGPTVSHFIRLHETVNDIISP